jgi:hypothetical protein
VRDGFVALGLCLLWAPVVLAQSGAGEVEGRITDADGSALPGVTVTVSNGATGFSRVTSSGAEGGYRFAGVPIGSYDVKFELSGFTTLTQAEVVVNVGSTRSVNVVLQVASVEESITVTTEAPLIRTAPSVERVVSQDELENLPLNGSAVREPRGPRAGHRPDGQPGSDQAEPADRGAQRGRWTQHQLPDRRR